MIIEIADPDDDRVGDFVRLKDPDLRRMRESTEGAEGGFFIAEGVTVIRALLASPYPIRSLFVNPLRWATLAPLVSDDVTVFLAPQAVLNAVAGFPMHRGALASANRLPLAPLSELCADASLVVATEGLNDHENLGALFRNAAAYGVDALVLDPASCDPLYRRSVRVSMGHVLRLPFTRMAHGVTGIRSLQALGFEVVALTPSADAEDIRSVGPAAGGRRALLVGAEGPGLTPSLLAAADRRVRIPMAAGVDSLNVAAATAVALYALPRAD